ncbi:MAG: hypothetical protein SNJ59_06810 [Aggregatilineales bacterium]
MTHFSAEAVPEPPSQIPAGPLRRWLIMHDDQWTFIVPYIGLAVLLSVLISLFWLVVVVAVHFALEIARQAYLARGAGQGGRPLLVAGRALWELKLDLALILFALTLSLYLEVTLGVVGLGAGARGAAMAGARVGARFTVIQQVLRGLLLSLDDLAQVVRVLLRRRKAPSGETAKEADPDDGLALAPIKSTRGDYTILGFAGVCALLIVAAPLLLDLTPAELLQQIAEEMTPFPAPAELFDID